MNLSNNFELSFKGVGSSNQLIFLLHSHFNLLRWGLFCLLCFFVSACIFPSSFFFSSASPSWFLSCFLRMREGETWLKAFNFAIDELWTFSFHRSITWFRKGFNLCMASVNSRLIIYAIKKEIRLQIEGLDLIPSIISKIFIFVSWSLFDSIWKRRIFLNQIFPKMDQNFQESGQRPLRFPQNIRKICFLFKDLMKQLVLGKTICNQQRSLKSDSQIQEWIPDSLDYQRKGWKKKTRRERERRNSNQLVFDVLSFFNIVFGFRKERP